MLLLLFIFGLPFSLVLILSFLWWIHVAAEVRKSVHAKTRFRNGNLIRLIEIISNYSTC